MELETLKTYIEINSANAFIQPFKSPAGASILVIRKSNNSFCPCVDYQSLNNLTIKTRYLLPLIGELLNWLGQAKQLTKFYLKTASDWIKIKEVNE